MSLWLRASSRGSGFHSLWWLTTICISRWPDTIFWFPWLPSMQVVHRHTSRQTHTHNDDDWKAQKPKPGVGMGLLVECFSSLAALGLISSTNTCTAQSVIQGAGRWWGLGHPGLHDKTLSQRNKRRRARWSLLPSVPETLGLMLSTNNPKVIYYLQFMLLICGFESFDLLKL